MKVSAKAEYACLAVITLAQQPPAAPPMSAGEIARLHDIPVPCLIQVMGHLKAAGLVYSLAGSSGGFRLARPAENISLGEVLSAVDGPSLGYQARRPAGQVPASALGRVRSAERAVLDGTSIAKLAREVVPHEWVI